ncbi:IQ calmodulin-binding motif-containing protein 1 isoform X4 [Mauremys reevesii]|uniref:IQ calmodulin-binding motif-containing protein 1 isoform X4 n=1 Tax=Mauremys reevesii TaxID=260615 RepID=UPI00193F15BF|nr:IQ calmodulin-binding motif-containing protein 1 isoform X4 [Mauremys reevesii]
MLLLSSALLMLSSLVGQKLLQHGRDPARGIPDPYKMKPAAVDFRILALATQVTESSDQDVPVLLLKLKEILNSTSLGSKESQKIKQDLYYYNLVQYCMLVLKQDYSRLPGGWATAAQLSEILSQCCVGLEVKEDPEEFYNKLLPSAVDNLLFLGRRLQARFIRAIKDEEKSEFLRCFRTVTDAICWLFGGHIQLTESVLQSNHFLQLLITDDVETATAMMSVLQNILRANSSVLLHVDEENLHSVLDELVYKLSSTTNPVTGNAATKVLLAVAESHPQLVELLSTRYRGLRTLLSKQWAGKGFDRNLNQLSDLLYSESCRKGEMQRLHQAACLIQAVWRGFQTRKRLKTLPKAVTALQRSFRAKRKQELQHLKRLKEDETLRQQLQLQRQRAMRLFHERQLTLLEIVHAGQVDRYIQEMEGKAALTIQRHWRGYRARRKVHQQRQSLKQHKAAVIIQRAASQMSEGMSKELHLQGQEKLAQYLLRSSLDRRAEQRREALLAQVNTDVELLMSAPSLMEATEKDLDVFMSRSVPVACKARQSHNTILKYTRWPWWKKLGDEFMDDDMIPDDVLNTEFGTLFIGGSKSS